VDDMMWNKGAKGVLFAPFSYSVSQKAEKVWLE
jgi:hypothetical protein